MFIWVRDLLQKILVFIIPEKESCDGSGKSNGEQKSEVANPLLSDDIPYFPQRSTDSPLPSESNLCGKNGIPQKIPSEKTETETPSSNRTEQEEPREALDSHIKEVAAVLPAKIRLSPNLTLGKKPAFIDYPLEQDIRLDKDYDETDQWKTIKTESGIRIIPKTAGELDIPIRYNNGACVHFQLSVNPDLSSLWQKREPEDNQIVFDQDYVRLKKRHKDLIAVNLPGWQVIGASRRGRSHEHEGTFRDDEMGYWADEATGRYAFFLADGAGSARFSREGARIAISVLREKFGANVTEALWKGAMDDDTSPGGKVGKMLVQLAYYAMSRIDSFVKDSNAANPERKWVIKDFNTTILIAAVKRDDDGGIRVVAFSIGDGVIAGYTGDNVRILTRPDVGEFCGGTRFLTMSSVWEKAATNWSAFYASRLTSVRFSPEETQRLILFLMSDGVSDPWFETDAGLATLEKWRHFVEDGLVGSYGGTAWIAPSENADVNAERLWQWLGFEVTSHYDDRTLIAIYPHSGMGKNVEQSVQKTGLRELNVKDGIGNV